MHKLNVLLLGPASFISTLNELKNYLKFNPILDYTNNPNIILFHTHALQNKEQAQLIKNIDCIKICAGKRKDFTNNCDAGLELPTSIKDLNSTIESTDAKKKFNLNSSIKIKNYLLNKNEKKLSKLDDHIILTEKEIHLLELFLKKNKPISKDNILSLVWNYSSDADTHTVETHIYRLRKKISEKFMDNNFILNNKDWYYL